MKLIHNTLRLLFLVFLLMSCDESEIQTYEGDNFIYFTDQAAFNDSIPRINYTFVFEEDSVTSMVLQLPVKVTGAFTGQDRRFSVDVLDGTAKEGQHYTILDEVNVIEDQATGGFLNIRFNRTADLADNQVEMLIGLSNDETFRQGTNYIYYLAVSDLFTEPEWWGYPGSSGFDRHIGPFTKVKGQQWLAFYGIKDGSDPWCCPPHWDGNFLGDRRSLNFSLVDEDIERFKLYLRDLEEEKGGPLLDENGDRVLDTFEYPDSN